MKTFYVIRSGWNAANQSSMGTLRNPKNKFESNQYKFIGIVDAASEESAVEAVNCSCYNGQLVWAVSNPRSIKGLTAEIRSFAEYEAEAEAEAWDSEISF